MDARRARMPTTALAGLVALAAACSEPAPRVSLVVVGDGTCGRPTGATGLEVTAFAAGGEVVRAVPLDQALDIADFPADTEQLGVEVIVGGGVVGAAGKTAPLQFTALADGATIPIFMAPLDSFCPAGALAVARRAPLVALAGDGVLVVGGVGPDDVPLGTAERYDLATGAWIPVAVPDVLGEQGFVGAALTPLPDGRVVVSGGPVPTITIYDPITHGFGESVLVEGRAFHTAVALDDRRVLLAGGCSATEAGACAGVVRKSSKRYAVDDLGTFEVGPTLAVGRIGATAIDLGVQESGAREVLVAGGTAPAGASDPAAGDRFALDPDGDATVIGNLHERVALLDGGAVLTATAGGASILAPGATAATAVVGAPGTLALAALEDGRVLGIGAEVVRYDPMIDRWERLSPSAPAVDTLLRLPDGSVLALGGADAWRFRPSLVGPATGALTVLPAGAARQHVLTPVDPQTVTRAPEWTLASGARELARALVGGPRFATGVIRAVVRVRAGGVALIAQQQAPGQAILVELAPGTRAALVRIDRGSRTVACRGEMIAAFAIDAPTTLELAIGDAVRVTRDGATVLACDLADRARGAWGIGALGAGAAIAVDTVAVARRSR